MHLSASFEVNSPNNLLWVQCDRQFSGYYVANYDASNWAKLAMLNMFVKTNPSLLLAVLVKTY